MARDNQLRTWRSYTHPAWTQALILADSDYSERFARDMLSADDDPRLLMCTPIRMSQDEYQDLPEWSS